MSNNKKLLTLEQAVAALPEGDSIHTFRAGGFALLGADWGRDELIEAMNRSETIEVGGENCQSMNHAIVFFDEAGPVFVEGAKGANWEALESSASGEV